MVNAKRCARALLYILGTAITSVINIFLNALEIITIVSFLFLLHKLPRAVTTRANVKPKEKTIVKVDELMEVILLNNLRDQEQQSKAVTDNTHRDYIAFTSPSYVPPF